MPQPEPTPAPDHAAIMAKLASLNAQVEAQHAAIRALGPQLLEALR